MSINRYVKDYRLIEEFDAKGHLRTTYKYIGKDWYYVFPKEQVVPAKIRCTAACAVSWILFVTALVPVSSSMHTLYIALPFAFTALAAGLLTQVVVTVFRTKEPMEHRHADRLNVRIPLSAVLLMAFAGISLLGVLVNLIRGIELTAGDAVFIPCAAALVLCGCFVFFQRKPLSMEER
ncbi:MAG: hypothetical protein J6Z23_06435 [Lachnospiraceae bacterium]|nr:hypothetical protein [Lachnospiraceae bacterium]